MQPPRLSEVISKIPKSCYDNPVWKGIYYCAVHAAVYLLCLVCLAITDSILALAALWIVATLLVSGLFILAHDAGHEALFKSKKLNRGLGRYLMLPSFHAFAAWDLGHNRIHHAFTIKQEKDFVWHPLSLEEYRELSLWDKLLHRIEWSAVGLGGYYLWEIWWKKMVVLTPPAKLKAAIDSDRRLVNYFFLLSLVVSFAVGLYLSPQQALGAGLLYGAWTWVKLFFVPWLGFNYIIGFTVYLHHISPEIPWHSDETWTKFKGQVEGTTIIRLPWLSNFFFHNIFIHMPHHVDPRIPFYKLNEAAEAIKKAYPSSVTEKKFSFLGFIRSTRLCKLYDFEKERWLNYAGKPVLSEA